MESISWKTCNGPGHELNQALRLAPPHARPVHELPGQITDLNRISIGDRHVSHSRAREVSRRRHAESARADDEDARARKGQLAREADFAEHELPAVACEGVWREGWRSKRKSRARLWMRGELGAEGGEAIFIVADRPTQAVKLAPVPVEAIFEDADLNRKVHCFRCEAEMWA
jgi:hypothetical protein